MAERTIEVRLTATDEASAVMQRVSAITQQQTRTLEASSQAMVIADREGQKLSRRWNELFSVTEYLAGGIKKLKNILEGIFWGAVIGAVSAVVSKLIDWVTEASRAKERAVELTKTIEDQARGWGLLPDKIKAVTQTTIELYNAQLRQIQLLRRDEGKGLEKQITDLGAWIEIQREVVRKSMNFPWALDKSVVAGIAESEVKLAEAKKKLEEWQNLMKMTPAILSNVKDHLDGTTKAAEKLHDSLIKQAADLEMQVIKLRDGEGTYLMALRERLIAQGGEVELVDKLISKMKELSLLQQMSQFKPRAPEYKPIVNVPEGPPVSEEEKKELERIARVMEKNRRYSIDMARQTAQGMQQAFQTYFFDAFQGKITSLRTVLSDFAHLAQQIISNVLAQMATAKIMSFFAAPTYGPAFNEGGQLVRKYAIGGPVISNGDSVPALLTPGEFVVSRKGVDMLNRINQGQAPMRGGEKVTVNVVNSGRDEKPQVMTRREFDNLVIDVIWRNYNQNGPLRGLMGA